VASNPQRDFKPNPSYNISPDPLPDVPEWQRPDPRLDLTASRGSAGYFIGAVVLVLAVLAILYFGLRGGTTTTSTETGVPSAPVQTIPKQVTPPSASEQQKSAPGATTGAPQTTEPQNTPPQPGTTKQ
jgi:hypothetical protein